MSKEAWRWRVLSSGFRFRWKRLNMIKFSFFNDVYFKIISAFEAVFIVSSLCFFFLCCGCHF
ncbi:Transient receptor potential cation channel subfamily V member 2 [Bienertia sinuspersici]